MTTTEAKDVKARLDRVSGVLNRALHGEPTLEPEFQKDEQLGALRFAVEYALAQLEDIRKAVTP